MKKGDIYLCDLGDFKNTHTQLGKRPVIIYQDTDINKYGKTLIVIPCSSNPKKIKQKTHLLIKTKTILIKPTFVLCEHVMVTDKDKILNKMGTLETQEIKQIDTIMKQLLQIGE